MNGDSVLRYLFWLSLLFALLLPISPRAHADIDQGIAWLQARDSATGVHRDSDLATAAQTNSEAWITVRVLSRDGSFSQLGALAQEQNDGTVPALARQAWIRLERGQSAAEILSALLSVQQTDGGFPVRRGFQSEALATAQVLALLDRAGLGSGTPASRAIGYLIGAQPSTGGWVSAPGNPPSVYASASVASILAGYRNRFDLTVPLARATTFLTTARTPQNDFGSAFETGLAIEALLALNADRSVLEPVVPVLAAQQLANGSFEDDAYVTAVVLRALWRFAQPVLPPTQAGITGRVLAADTSMPISGAQLQLTGPDSVTLVSNSLGRLQSQTIPAGQYQATLSFTGMRTVQLELTLVAGRTLDLGDLRMVQGTSPVGEFGLIRGVVRSAETGDPIGGARVRLSQPPTQVVADADGRYQLLQVPAGLVHITGEADGYSTQTAEFTLLPEAVVEFSMSLTPVAGGSSQAEIRGQVAHGQTGAALAGVQIAATAGTTPASILTGADGSYTFNVDPGALVTIEARLSGFDPVSIQVPLVANQVLVFSPRMYPEGETPNGSNQSSISGIVVNQATRAPVRGARIVVNDSAGQQVLTSDATGTFVALRLSGPTTQLTISADAFSTASLLVPILPLEQRDLGEIGLRPSTINFYLPDLRITGSSLSTTDPDSFALNGQFLVEVINAGTSAVSQDFTLLAFIDANGNGRFDPGVEPEVGRVRVTDDLPIGSATSVAIAVVAQTAFRDAPIAFWVDAENEVPEQDENNNTGSSLLGCRVSPAFIAGDTVYEAWRWSGLASNPQINSLNQVPVVVQLTDDNDDGLINEYDIPDLVFVAGRRNSIAPGQTALVAISGDDGRELWSVSSPILSHFTSIAAGDIDNDGIAEIVAIRGYRQELIAYEHDGTLKWRTTLDGPGIPAVLIPPPPYVYDTPVIVNLEGDNEAEIILGRQAYRGFTGEKLWEGEFDAGGDGGKPIGFPLSVAFGQGSIAADINMDGVVEVLAGRTLYDYAGRTIWHRADIKPVPYQDAIGRRMNFSGANALGNFDLDDFPEIVLTIGEEMYLLEHTGETIWGPRYAPDGTTLGAPTVGDIDNDGLPEIIVASRGKLTVFETDGTVKWTTDIEDSSSITGATFFDFENDGLYEIVHMDEENLRILDALTGAELFRTRNVSVTVGEYPIVADIDGDKQAEIIITSFDRDLVAGTTPGIRVFKARQGAWADAGSVWGSHAFHINEINEDSTVPLLETPSWLTHNTYRAQRSPFPDPLGMPDFTVGDLRLIDRGPGLNPVVQVRVGNAGPVDAHEPPFIGVYRGDPAAGGTLLREMRLDGLRPARFQVVNLGEVTLSGSGDLYAVIDQRNRAKECREGNNHRVIAFAATNGLGDLQLSSDQASYAPGATPRFTATVANQGALPAQFRVEWLIRNAQNAITANLDPVDTTIIDAGQNQAIDQLWSSQGVLAGTYVLVGRLYNASNVQIDTATLSFAIVGSSSGPSGGITLLASRAEYAPGVSVDLTWQARNLSSSETIRLPEVVISVSGPAGFSAQRAIPLNDLFAGASVEDLWTLDNATAAGNYSATARLRSRLTGFEYASANAQFVRLQDLSAEIQGSVLVARASLMVGEVQTCLFTARNRGNSTQTNVALRKRVVGLDTSNVVFEQLFTADLAPGVDHVSAESLATVTFPPEDYACILEVATASDWRILDAQAFALLGEPDAGIDVEPTAGLVTSEGGQSAQFSVRLTRAPSAEVVVPLESSDTTEWSLSQAEVRFPVASWDVPRQVTVFGVDDDLVDGDQEGFIRVLPAQSADAAYNGIDAPDVAITNLDDDLVQVRVQPLAIETSESGSSASFQVWLNAEPTAPVRIAVSSSDSSEWSLAISELVFTTSNYAQAQVVVVTGVDDPDLDGTQLGFIVLAPAESLDPRYDGIDPPDVAARNLDNDSPSIIVEPTEVVTAESGLSGSFTVRLGAPPSAQVRIPIGVVDTTEWQISDAHIDLNPSNWQAGYTVNVLPVDDDLVDGDQSAVLLLLPAQSSDLRYDGLDPADVLLTNLDDDGTQILVEPTGGLVVDENGASDQFVVSLTEEPTAVVTVAITSGDLSEFSVAPDEVQFAPGDWAPRTVVVTGVDDDEADGNILGRIITAPAVSADLRYHGINPSDVGVTNLDNEMVQISVTPAGSIDTSEDGTQAIITLRLSAPPTADVVVPVVNPDASEWSLDRSELRFTPADWATAQVLTVTGVNDFEIDGDQFGVIGLSPAVSADPLYNGIDPIDVPAVNRDNDAMADILVSPEGPLVTSESGTSASFSLTLSTEPTAPVTVLLTNPDTTEWLLDRNSVVFDPADWQQPRTVLVTGVDDDLVDGDISGVIVLHPAQSSDARFDGVDPRDMAVINLDDDVLPPPQWVLLEDDLVVSEDGDQGQFRIAFSRAPTAPVRVAFSSDDTGEVLIAPEEWIFEIADATVLQTIMLTGVDDFIDDGDQQVTLRVRVVSSLDPEFAALAPLTLIATNLDNDSAGVNLSLSGPAQITEGESTRLDVTLQSQPTAALALHLQATLRAPGQPGDLIYALEPQRIDVTPEQWQQSWPLSLNTTDNGILNPDQIVDVQVVSIDSTDPLYAALTAGPVAVEVRDRGASRVEEIPINRGLLALFLLLLLTGLLALPRGRGVCA